MTSLSSYLFARSSIAKGNFPRTSRRQNSGKTRSAFLRDIFPEGKIDFGSMPRQRVRVLRIERAEPCSVSFTERGAGSRGVDALGQLGRNETVVETEKAIGRGELFPRS